MPAPRRLVIAGYYGYGNAGDEAILAATLDELRRRRPELQIVVASGDPARTSAEHGVESVQRDDLAAVDAAVRASDLVLLGGGGILEDYWEVPLERIFTARTGGLPAYVGVPVLAALYGKRCMLYAVGVGPLRTEAGRAMAAGAFALADAATVRDEASLREALALGLAAEVEARVTATADPAVLLEPVDGDELRALAARLGLRADEPLIGAALRPWVFAPESAGWEGEAAAALADVAAQEGARVLLLPFHPAEDLPVLRQVAAALPASTRHLVVEAPLAPRQLAGLLGRCRRVLAMRYHAALFALQAGVPTAALAYDPKVRSIVEAAGSADLALPPAQWQAPAIAAALRAARPADGDWRVRLRERAARNVDTVLRLLDAPPRALDAGESLLREIALQKVAAAAAQERELAEARRQHEESAAALQAGLASEREQASRLREQAAALEAANRAAHAEAARLDAALTATNADVAALREDASRRDDELRRLRQQREWLVAERNDVARRLAELEGTVAYALLSRFWAAMRRLFPPGARRRRALYRLGRRMVAAVARVKRSPRAAAPLAAGASALAGASATAAGEALAPPAAPQIAATDPLHELMGFEDEVRRRNAAEVVAIFSATQLVESEGQRPTQLALALARRGIPVVFVYWRWWEHEWRPQDWLDDGILQLPIDVVARKPEMLTPAFAGLRRTVLFEFPWPGFFSTLAAANAAGWVTAYDVLDDWEEFHRVGQAIWYEEPFERHLLTAVDAIFAVNAVLAERVRELGAREVEIVGNGLKGGLDHVYEPRPLERGEVTVGYFGYLAGAWFDWELVAAAARRRPSWRFYLIGYGGSPAEVTLPDNVRLLGKQPQSDLAAFAAHWDVAVVPFKDERLAWGADPIKTYEYLAMGLPVVVTGVHPPAGGERLVRRAAGVEAFVEALAAAARERARDVTARQAFAAECGWERRLDAMLATLAAGQQRVAEKLALAGRAA